MVRSPKTPQKRSVPLPTRKSPRKSPRKNGRDLADIRRYTQFPDSERDKVAHWFAENHQKWFEGHDSKAEKIRTLRREVVWKVPSAPDGRRQKEWDEKTLRRVVEDMVKKYNNLKKRLERETGDGLKPKEIARGFTSIQGMPTLDYRPR